MKAIVLNPIIWIIYIMIEIIAKIKCQLYYKKKQNTNLLDILFMMNFITIMYKIENHKYKIVVFDVLLLKLFFFKDSSSSYVKSLKNYLLET